MIPWANDPGEDGNARMWQVHYEAIGQQANEWKLLRRLYSHAPLIVAGDFNQSRDESGWYGTEKGRALLSTAMDQADLTCATEADAVAQGWLAKDHLVDHVALSRDLVADAAPRVTCWEKHDEDGVRISDHPTVAVDL